MRYEVRDALYALLTLTFVENSFLIGWQSLPASMWYPQLLSYSSRRRYTLLLAFAFLIAPHRLARRRSSSNPTFRAVVKFIIMVLTSVIKLSQLVTVVHHTHARRLPAKQHLFP